MADNQDNNKGFDDNNVYVHFLDIVKKDYDDKILELREDIGRLGREIEKIDGEIEKRCTSLNDKMDMNKQSTYSKFDAIDKTLRGNGNIGYSEHIRGLSRNIRYLWFAVAFLFGFKVFGISLMEWSDSFWTEANSSSVKELVETKEGSSNIPEIVIEDEQNFDKKSKEQDKEVGNSN